MGVEIMNLSDLKTLTRPQMMVLKSNDWDIEKLATAQTKDLTELKGIGKKTAEKVIEEAALLVNAQGLKVAEKLAVERYYQKTPPWKIIQDWEEAGLSLQDIALSSFTALSLLKGIDEHLAARCIGVAQTKVNERKLMEGQQISPMVGGGADQKETPPSRMSVRVQRANDKIEEANG